MVQAHPWSTTREETPCHCTRGRLTVERHGCWVQARWLWGYMNTRDQSERGIMDITLYGDGNTKVGQAVPLVPNPIA